MKFTQLDLKNFNQLFEDKANAGYVLDFSDKTMREFFESELSIDIDNGPFPNEMQQTKSGYAASRCVKNTSLGERYPSDFRPLTFRICSSLAISSSLTSVKSVPFG